MGKGKEKGKRKDTCSSLAARRKPAKKGKKSGFKPPSASSSTSSSSEEVIGQTKGTIRSTEKSLLFKNCKKLWVGHPCLPSVVEDQYPEMTCGPRVIPVICAAAVHLDNPLIPRKALARQELVNKFGDPETTVFPGMEMDDGFKYIRDVGIGLEENLPFTGTREMNVEFSPTPGPRTFIGGYEILDENDYAKVCEEINARPLACTVEMTSCFSNFYHRGETIYRKHKLPASILKEDDSAPSLPPSTEPEEPDLHFVKLLGHGEDPLCLGQKKGDGDFYVIQNTMGTDWGKQGSAKIAPNEIFGIFAPLPPYRSE